MSPPDTIEGQAEPSPDPVTAAAAKRPNYFVRHWRGDLSLGVSYWVNLVLVSLFLTLLGLAVSGGIILLAIPLPLIDAWIFFGLAFGIVISVWQFVGVWRSASNHVSRGGTRAWATVAKVMLVLGLLRLVFIVWKSLIPQLAAIVSMLTGDAGMPSYEIKVLPGGTEIVFRGAIRGGCAKALERVLSATTQAKVLEVESRGGRISEARRMGRLVREHGLTTYTADFCMSAATLVLISGKERVVAPEAKIGFHAGALPGATLTQRIVMRSVMRSNMRSAGVSDAFIDHVLATPSNQIWYPTFKEMREAGVLTRQAYIRNEDKPDYIKRLEGWNGRKAPSADRGDSSKAAKP